MWLSCTKKILVRLWMKPCGIRTQSGSWIWDLVSWWTYCLWINVRQYSFLLKTPGKIFKYFQSGKYQEALPMTSYKLLLETVEEFILGKDKIMKKKNEKPKQNIEPNNKKKKERKFRKKRLMAVLLIILVFSHLNFLDKALLLLIFDLFIFFFSFDFCQIFFWNAQMWVQILLGAKSLFLIHISCLMAMEYKTTWASR